MLFSSRVQILRVLMERGDGTQSDITNSAEGFSAISYIKTARKFGLSDLEIEEDIGGYEVGEFVYDGLIEWACEAIIMDDAVIVFAPD